MSKERITVTLSDDTLRWIDKKIDEKIFANRSHSFEMLIAKKMRQENIEKR